ncbi:hypothetical protein HMPREF9394_2204 [Streptococcus sanguinis SK1057]|nr:hypothetical protein HMPREF9394_2204 [Streptococcus sanguinis SK1057]
MNFWIKKETYKGRDINLGLSFIKKIETGLLGAYPPKSLSHFTIY